MTIAIKMMHWLAKQDIKRLESDNDAGRIAQSHFVCHGLNAFELIFNGK